MISLFEIFKIYFVIGCQLFGGGYVILPLLKKYLIEDKKWIKEDELLDYFSLSQCLPGIIAVNISIFSGYKLRKIKGAIVSLFALILPSFISIILIASFLNNLANNKIIQDIFFGVRISVIVLIFYMIYDVFKSYSNKLFSVILYFIILFLIIFTPLTPAMLVLLTVLAVLFGRRK